MFVYDEGLYPRGYWDDIEDLPESISFSNYLAILALSSHLCVLFDQLYSPSIPFLGSCPTTFGARVIRICIIWGYYLRYEKGFKESRI